MMRRSFMQCHWTVVVVLVLWQPCNGAEFGVGGDGNWAPQELGDASYYQSWANGINFEVGDSIGFVYDKSALDVRSLPDASALDACDFSESTLLGSTGNTVVPLNDATTYYFSSNKDGFSVECSTFGVRFQAVVTNATTARSPPPPAFVKLPSPPQAGSSGGFDFHQGNTGTGLPSTPSSGSGVNVPAVVGGTSSVVGVGAIASILYYFRVRFNRSHNRPPQHSQHPIQHLQHPHAQSGGSYFPSPDVNSSQLWQYQMGQIDPTVGQFSQPPLGQTGLNPGQFIPPLGQTGLNPGQYIPPL